MRQKRKAISPIIATLILIVITVIAGIFLYGFVSGYMGTLSGTTNQPPPNIQFVSASYNSSGLYFVVYNAGTQAVTLQSSAVTVNSNNPSQTFTETVYGSLTLTPNQQTTIKVSNSGLTQGNYYVKFVTTSGYTIQSPTVYVS
mgnify:CR=1 FL=1